MEFLVLKGYTDSAGVVNVKKLVGTNQTFGRGTGTTDVYKVEILSTNDGYELNYYDTTGTKTDKSLWTVKTSI